MDFTESAKAVFDRVRMFEPELASKIVGYLLLSSQGDQEMVRLAFCPDNLLQSIVSNAKMELASLGKKAIRAPVTLGSVNLRPTSDAPPQLGPYCASMSQPFASPPLFPLPPSCWDPHLSICQQPVHNMQFVPHTCYVDKVGDEYHPHDKASLLSVDDQLDSPNSVEPEFSSRFYYPEHAIWLRSNRRVPSLPEFPVKICHYFNKGYCKHGTSCRYFHGEVISDGYSQVANPASNDFGDEHIFSPGSLEKLEMELTELLKSRRGIPVSIASLPMLYYEKYGKNLQADGYLTESQRHGKAGYSLTKLLARLKNSIRLIDRPHGQHSVVLAEDAFRYTECRSDRIDPGVVPSGSRQIYLTFPAESTFSEEDVSEYFKIFGPVQDVRIPSQQKRMFGFVTFVYSETVKEILAKGNPHFVCGARVLVKPYREKSRIVDRKYQEKIDPSVCYSPRFLNMEPQLHPMAQICGGSRLFSKIADEQEEKELYRRMSQLHLVSRHIPQQPNCNALVPADSGLYDEKFNFVVGALNRASFEDNAGGLKDYNEQDSQIINLPESPFASPVASGISTVS